MNDPRRRRFILRATGIYLVSALAWIFLSDRMLLSLTSIDTLARLSTAKGIFFVLASAVALILTLRAMPASSPTAPSTSAPDDPADRPATRWGAVALHYALAIILPLSMVFVRNAMSAMSDGHPEFILFALPIVLSAMLGGLGPGILATAIAMLGVDLASTPALHSSAASPHDQFRWAMLLLNGVVVSFLAEKLLRTMARQEHNRWLLDAVVSGTSDAVFVKNRDGRYLLANAAAAAFVDKPLTSLVGACDKDLFDAPSARQLHEIDQGVMARAQVQTHEECVTIQGGQARVFLVTKGPVFDGQGRVDGLFGIGRDISSQKEAAARLVASEERLQRVIEATSDGFWEWDVVTGRVYRSPRYYEVMGARPEEDAHDRAFFERHLHPDDRAAVLQAIDAHRLGASKNIDFDFRLANPALAGRWLRSVGRAVARDAAGLATRIVGTVSDITERRRTEQALREREQQLARVLEGADQGYWDWNLQTNTFQVSQRFESMLGYVPGEMQVTTEHWPELVHPDDLPLAMASIKQHMSGQSASHEVEMRCRTRDGGWRWILTRGRIVSHAEDGTPLMMSGTHTDITERKQHELAQREAGVVFESSYEGIMVANPEGRITKVNPAFTRITGYTQDEVTGRSPHILSSGRHDAAFYQALWASLNQYDFWRGEIWNRRKNGEIFAVLQSISAVRDMARQIRHYVSVFTDISQIKAHEAELDRVAHYDTLTGLPNRRLLSDRLHQSTLRAERSGKSSAVCFLDLDGFKLVNDQHGHAVGDQLLVGVAEHLKTVLRAEDTLARLGGDEFVLLFSEVASPEECTLILDRVLQAARRPVHINEHLFSISASIGVSLYPADNADPDTLLRHADQAMYLAKQAGKNRYQLFDPHSDRLAQSHRAYLGQLQLALERGEFVLLYQPKVDLASGEVIGVEALARWQHPERGLLAPGDFLPHLHGSDLEQRFGEWVIETALGQMQEWIDQGLEIKVSVNVSANHLLQADFCERLDQALSRHQGVQPSSLELEVLETAAIEDIEQAVEILQRCRELGVRFALDDFGTGYSSLTYLRKLPVDTLKIDQSFVRDMLIDPDDLGIVQGVIQLAGVFHRQVIAEGVETLEHGSALRQMGCRFAQGYGIARPMPASEFLVWRTSWLQAGAWLNI